MTPVSPRMRKLALQLIEYERRASLAKTGGAKKSESAPKQKANSDCDFAAFEKLRPHLVTLMSKLGFHALVLRARALTLLEVPWLSDLTISADGSIGWRGKSAAKLAPQEIVTGSHLFLARLLTLLESFIGDTLTMQLVSEVWPDVPLDDLDSDRGELIEKAN